MGIRKIRFARRAALFATFVAFALATGVLPSPAAAKNGGGHRGGGHQVKVNKGGQHAKLPKGGGRVKLHKGGGRVKLHKGGRRAKLHKGGGRAYRRGHRAYRGGNYYAGLFGSLLGYRPYYARGAYYAPRRRAYVPRFRPDRRYYKPSAHRGYGRACHTVSKIGYGDYGRKAKIGGTMCYDSYGNSYIVKGSRYVIHYY